MLKIIISLFITVLTYAQSTQLDKKLSTYINQFNLKPISKPTQLNPELYQLGRELFFEKMVSGNKNISCSTCHHPQAFSGDALPLPIGAGGEGIASARVSTKKGQVIPRNSPALYNLGHKSMNIMFWDGRVSYHPQWETFSTPEPALNGDYPERWDITEVLDSALAAQALFPPLSHAEMRGPTGSNEIANATTNQQAWKLIMKRLFNSAKYVKLFKQAYPETTKFNIGHFGKALGHFQKHEFAAFDTAWDNYLQGDLTAMSVSEKKGAGVFFERGRCINCHNGDLLGGGNFRNIVSPQVGPGKDIKNNDEGRFLVTKRERDKYSFRTPPLRNVALTAPYFHSGSYTTLQEVLKHYNDGIKAIDKYDAKVLSKYEENNYKERLFVETNNYMIFKKKETAHPLVKRNIINLSKLEMNQLEIFLKQSLTEKKFLNLAN